MRHTSSFAAARILTAWARPVTLLAALMVGAPAPAAPAGNGCGCSTGEYGVTCCNPGEKAGGTCTVYLYDDEGRCYGQFEVDADLDLC
jgi:hypothetical protein